MRKVSERGGEATIALMNSSDTRTERASKEDGGKLLRVAELGAARCGLVAEAAVSTRCDSRRRRWTSQRRWSDALSARWGRSGDTTSAQVAYRTGRPRQERQEAGGFLALQIPCTGAPPNPRTCRSCKGTAEVRSSVVRSSIGSAPRLDSNLPRFRSLYG